MFKNYCTQSIISKSTIHLAEFTTKKAFLQVNPHVSSEHEETSYKDEQRRCQGCGGVTIFPLTFAGCGGVQGGRRVVAPTPRWVSPPVPAFVICTFPDNSRRVGFIWELESDDSFGTEELGIGWRRQTQNCGVLLLFLPVQVLLKVASAVHDVSVAVAFFVGLVFIEGLVIAAVLFQRVTDITAD